MKKKLIIILMSTIMIGSIFTLNGCGKVDLTQIGADETTLSAEMEKENLSDGFVTLHCSWSQADGSVLAGATITLLDGRKEVFSGSTDENGRLEIAGIPGNTTLKCLIAGADGSTLASSEVIFKLSSDYTAITIYPVHGDEDKEHVVDVPTAKTDIRASIFVTESGQISFANMSPYIASDESEDVPAEGEDAPAEGEDAPAEGEGAAPEGGEAPVEG